MKHLFAASVAAATLWAGVAVAENVALVIGNGTYTNAPKAETAERDAAAVAKALTDAGWQVTQGQNLDRAGMRDVITQFAAASREADKLVIFYSGHAIRAGGVSFLAPVDARGETLTDVVFDGVALDLLLALAAPKADNAVIFVDAAQLRGFTPTPTHEPGLADLEGPDGVLIVSAAEPGHAVRRSRWRDSRFARLIIDQFLSPGEPVMAVADAADGPTWTTGSVGEEFTLAALPEPSSGLEAEIELAYWRTAEKSGDPEDYRAYLERYPNGTFAKFARDRLGLAPGAAVPTDPEVDPRIEAERDLKLSRLQKRRIQEYLAALGFDPRGIDGLFGPGSRNAIQRWQIRNGFDNEGWLTGPQIKILTQQGDEALREARLVAEQEQRIREAEDNAYWQATGAKGTGDAYRAYLEAYPEGLHAATARAALARMAEAEDDELAREERRAFRRAERRGTPEAYRNYLAQYPDGIYRDEALAALDEIETAERAVADNKRYAAIETNLGLSRNDRISLEKRLRFLGFEVGKEDGVLDKRTRSGIRGYQASRGFEDTGYFDRQTVVTLVRETDRAAGQVQIDGAAVIRGVLEALGNQ